MNNELVKSKMTKEELQVQLASCTHIVVRKYNAIDRLDAEVKELNEEINTKMAKQFERKREILKIRRVMSEQATEALGGYRMLIALLAKVGVKAEAHKALERKLEEVSPN